MIFTSLNCKAVVCLSKRCLLKTEKSDYRSCRGFKSHNAEHGVAGRHQFLFQLSLSILQHWAIYCNVSALVTLKSCRSPQSVVHLWRFSWWTKCASTASYTRVFASKLISCNNPKSKWKTTTGFLSSVTKGDANFQVSRQKYGQYSVSLNGSTLVFCHSSWLASC